MVIELRVVQVWSEIILVISNRTCATRSFDFEITRMISDLILLPEKFLQFDWLRADVFQLNLKYLHVKITVTMVTANHHIISKHEFLKNGGKIPRF